MLVYIRDEAAATKFISSVMTAYTMYFNKKYKRRGPLCESRFKAVIILQNDQLMHITRYIHLNPDDWRAYPYSSIHAYYGIGRPEWLQPERIVDLFASLPHYADFLDDHEGYKESLLDVGQDMANTIL